MADRGRQPGFRMTEEHRSKIKNSQILNNLIECAEGTRELSSTQANVGIALLRKVMPDLSSTTIQGDEESPLQVIQRIERVIKDAPDRNG